MHKPIDISSSSCDHYHMANICKAIVKHVLYKFNSSNRCSQHLEAHNTRLNSL